MATASAVYTKSATLREDVSLRSVTYYGTVAIDAAPDNYAAGGLTLDLTSGTLQGGVPDDVKIEGAGGWLYKYVAGTGIANGKIMVFGYEPSDATVGVLPLVEFSDATAVPATVSGDAIKIKFTMRKGK